MDLSKETIAGYLGIDPNSMTQNRNDNDPFRFIVDPNRGYTLILLVGKAYEGLRPVSYKDPTEFVQALFETDLPETLMALICASSSDPVADECIAVFCLAAGTQEGRRQLITRGVGSCLAKTILQKPLSWKKCRFERWVYIWMNCLRQIVYHIKTEDISGDFVRCLLSMIEEEPLEELSNMSFNCFFMPEMAFDILERLLIRKLDDPRVWLQNDGRISGLIVRLQRAYQVTIDGVKLRRLHVRIEHNILTAVYRASIIAVLSMIDNRMSSTEIIIDQTVNLRKLLVGNEDNQERLITAKRNRRREQRWKLHPGAAALDPGESLYMYLGMCNSSASDIRVIGVLRLWMQIKTIDNFVDVEFGSHPNNTPSANAYKRQARLALGMPEEGLSRHAVFATTLLRLANDPDPDVRHFGEATIECIPTPILMQGKWSLEVHRFFPSQVKDVVETMLKLARRKDDGIPIIQELLVRVVFPFACDALQQP